jgi:hypothetical protein
MVRFRSGSLLALVWIATLTVAQAPSFNDHPGTVVDALSHTPIEAEATAYSSSQKNGGSGDCPTYDGQLFQTSSVHSSGEFTLRIPAAVPSFSVVYCQSGYAWFLAPGIDNSQSGSQVDPHPVPLYPNQSTLDARGVNSEDAAYSAIVGVLSGAEVDLANFRRADPLAFAAATKRLPPAEQRLWFAMRDAMAQPGDWVPPAD